MKIKYVLISLLVAGLGYASFVGIQQMQLLKNSCIKPSGYRFEKLGLHYARLIIGLRVINKSDINLLITNEKFDIYLNNVFVSSIRQQSNKQLAKGQPVDLRLVIEFDPLSALKNAAQSMIQNSGNVNIQIKGKLTVISKYVIINNIKIDESFTLAQILTPAEGDTTC